MDRFSVETARKRLSTMKPIRQDDEGNAVHGVTSQYTSIKLVDNQGVWPETEFSDFNFAQMCATALNNMTEHKKG